VGDENVGQAELIPEFIEQIQNLSLDRNIQG